MPRSRLLLSHSIVHLLLLSVGAALTLLYLVQYGDPPYPALVPIAFWFFFLAHISLLWLLRLLTGGPSSWQPFMTLGLAAALTIVIYLAGYVGEQQRQIDLQERQLSD